MNMRKRASNIQKEWLLLFLWIILLHVFYITITIATADNSDFTPIIWLTVGYLIAFAVIAFIFARRISHATFPRELKEAREQGIVASAKVLDIKRTRWRNPSTRNLRLQVSPVRFEYEMRVRVNPPDAPEYEAQLAEYLSGDEIPTKGDTIAVKIHPQHSEIIVMVRDKSA